MGLVSFDERYRRLWMFPRNIRRIYPWKIAQILALLKDTITYSDWSGNQSTQDAFCKALEHAGLKRTGIQYDPHSGGPRTYFSQLKSLGLIFEREDGNILFTKAGDDLILGVPPLPVIQNLLLNHQYPSIYSELGGVLMHPNIKVKPFMFILKLLLHPDVKYLNVKELCIPVIYGHNNDCFDLCVEKILKYRHTNDILSVIDNEYEDIYTRRIRGKALPKRLMAVNDIANTFKNCLQAACLIDVEKVESTEVFHVSNVMISKIKRALEYDNIYLPVENEESFQRKYGCWNSEKDTRNLTDIERVSSPIRNIILGLFYEYIGNNILEDYPENFVDRMKSEYGFNDEEIRGTIEPHLKTSLSFFESTFLNMSTGGIKTATDFEKATCSLFANKLKFKTKHTGQISRDGVGGYSDIFAVALDDLHCAIIDTKASSCYKLSSDDYHKMLGNYIPNYVELTDGRPLKLEFVSYVAGGFGSINSKLKNLSNQTGIGVSAISARELLALSQKNINKENQPLLREAFQKNKVLLKKDFDI